MHVVIIVLTVIVAILLIGIVLIQKSKGGGLSSQFGGANAVMGVRQTNTFLEKATWTLVSALVVLSVISAFTMPKASVGTELRTKPAAPAAPLPFPASSTPPLLSRKPPLPRLWKFPQPKARLLPLPSSNSLLVPSIRIPTGLFPRGLCCIDSPLSDCAQKYESFRL